ncbi:hypothetical protein M758_2G050000 [Ceratodon purpureus]|nr:hypothetical protein M758_2G050000 [Ceratodon purpureus]
MRTPSCGSTNFKIDSQRKPNKNPIQFQSNVFEKEVLDQLLLHLSVLQKKFFRVVLFRSSLRLRIQLQFLTSTGAPATNDLTRTKPAIAYNQRGYRPNLRVGGCFGE